MCSFVNEWNFINKGFIYIRILFEKIILYMIYLFVFISPFHIKDAKKNKNKLCTYQNSQSNSQSNSQLSILYKLVSTISKDIMNVLLDNYCI